jgi:aminopeptidase N
LLHTSNRFQQASAEAYDTRITSYWLPGHEAAGMAALQHTAASLRIFSDYFGPYPFTDLRVASAPINFRGMEYPQAYLLGVQLYDQYRNELEIRAAHEVAHQWWYQMVHNDPVNLPWIDEGLAEYATRLYYESMQGTAYAQNLQDRRWQAVLDNLIFRGQDELISLPVMGYEDARIYEAIVYGKGALFFDRIRTALGERSFRAFLREYLETYRYTIVGHEEIWQLLAKYDPQVADSLFENWIGEVPRPAEPGIGE